MSCSLYSDLGSVNVTLFSHTSLCKIQSVTDKKEAANREAVVSSLWCWPDLGTVTVAAAKPHAGWVIGQLTWLGNTVLVCVCDWASVTYPRLPKQLLDMSWHNRFAVLIFLNIHVW